MKKFFAITILSYVLFSPVIVFAVTSNQPNPNPSPQIDLKNFGSINTNQPATNNQPTVQPAQFQEPSKNPCKIQRDTSGKIKPAEIPRCISQIYSWSIGIAALLATGAIVYGGYLVMTAAGNGEQASEGKGYIGSAVGGLVLLFSAYLILRTINPELVQFNLRGFNDYVNSTRIDVKYPQINFPKKPGQ